MLHFFPLTFKCYVIIIRGVKWFPFLPRVGRSNSSMRERYTWYLVANKDLYHMCVHREYGPVIRKDDAVVSYPIHTPTCANTINSRI